jgi:hypothetical protein
MSPPQHPAMTAKAVVGLDRNPSDAPREPCSQPVPIPAVRFDSFGISQVRSVRLEVRSSLHPCGSGGIVGEEVMRPVHTVEKIRRRAVGSAA